MEFSELQLRRSLIDRDIPLRMHGGLIRWILDGIKPGHFLTAVIENNLSESISRGDEINIALLQNYVKFLYNDAPSNCWGSKEKVELWAQQKGFKSQRYAQLPMNEVEQIIAKEHGDADNGE